MIIILYHDMRFHDMIILFHGNDIHTVCMYVYIYIVIFAFKIKKFFMI